MTKANHALYARLFLNQPSQQRVKEATEPGAGCIERMMAAKELLGKSLSEVIDEKDLGARTELLNELLDIVRDDWSHPFADFVHAIGHRIENYETLCERKRSS